jgi:hypothetical protein
VPSPTPATNSLPPPTIPHHLLPLAPRLSAAYHLGRALLREAASPRHLCLCARRRSPANPSSPHPPGG